MENTENLNLPYLMAAQAQKHVTHNEALRMLDGIVQLAVVSDTKTAPPQSPNAGARYIVPVAATGDWANRVGQIAAWQDSAWSYFQPQDGWRSWVVDQQNLAVFHSGQWNEMGGGGSSTQVAFLGINAVADTTNRLNVSASATLLNNDGAGHQLKMNKAQPSDTASLLFQTGFSGRAEMGIVGDDSFSIKVSPDGTQFLDAIKIDAGTGNVQFPQGTNLSIPSIQFAEKTNPFETASTTYVDVPGLSITLTSKSATSKFLIFALIFGAAVDNHSGYVRLLRNGTEILSGDSSLVSATGNNLFLDLGTKNNWTVPTHCNGGVDAPQTASPVIYKLQAKTGSADEPVFINQNFKKTSASNFLGIPASRLIVVEFPG